MIEVVTGTQVWQNLHDAYLTGNDRKYAAIAYIGSRANEWLNLGPGDALVFDGDDRSIKANHINLDVIEDLMDLGVTLYSRSGLHAKVMVVESSKPIAIVGSANASVTSVESKAEAVMVTDQRAAVDEVRLAITIWQAGVQPLDESWLKRVRQLPPDRRTAPSEYASIHGASLIDPARPMWLVDWFRTNGRYSNEAIEAAATEEQQRGLRIDMLPLA